MWNAWYIAKFTCFYAETADMIRLNRQRNQTHTLISSQTGTSDRLCIPPLAHCLWFHRWLIRLYTCHHSTFYTRIMCRLALGRHRLRLWWRDEEGERRLSCLRIVHLNVKSWAGISKWICLSSCLSLSLYCFHPPFYGGHCCVQLCPHSHLHFLRQSHVSISI